MKSRQEIFDIVHDAILKQNALSQEKSYSFVALPRCLYRGPNGLKCAAGHLIPDSKYSRKMEGTDAHYGLVAEILIAEGYDPFFVQKLQSIHDRSQNMDEWKRKMKSFAIDNDLNFKDWQ